MHLGDDVGGASFCESSPPTSRGLGARKFKVRIDTRTQSSQSVSVRVQVNFRVDNRQADSRNSVPIRRRDTPFDDAGARHAGKRSGIAAGYTAKGGNS